MPASLMRDREIGDSLPDRLGDHLSIARAGLGEKNRELLPAIACDQIPRPLEIECERLRYPADAVVAGG